MVDALRRGGRDASLFGAGGRFSLLAGSISRFGAGTSDAPSQPSLRIHHPVSTVAGTRIINRTNRINSASRSGDSGKVAASP